MTGAHEIEGAAIVHAFDHEDLLTSHQLLPASQRDVTLRALARLADVKSSLDGKIVRDAAGLLFVVALQRVAATEVLREAQIPKSVQRKARGVLELVDGSPDLEPKVGAHEADALCAAFALSGRSDIRLRLRELAERGTEA